MKKLILCAALVAASGAFAQQTQLSVFGIDITKTDCKSAMKAVHATKIEEDQGIQFAQSDAPGQVLDDAEDVMLACLDGKAHGVLTSLPKGQMSANMKEYYNLLRSKYGKTKSGPPSAVGDYSAVWTQKGGTIALEAKHLSFTFHLNYLSDRMLSRFQAEAQRINSEKQASKKSKL